MGLFGAIATKSEIRLWARFEEDLRAAGFDGNATKVLVPCHMANENHCGLAVEVAGVIVAAYRCSGQFWGFPVSTSQRDLLAERTKIATNAAALMMSRERFQLGPLSQGTAPLAYAIATRPDLVTSALLPVKVLTRSSERTRTVEKYAARVGTTDNESAKTANSANPSELRALRLNEFIEEHWRPESPAPDLQTINEHLHAGRDHRQLCEFNWLLWRAVAAEVQEGKMSFDSREVRDALFMLYVGSQQPVDFRGRDLFLDSALPHVVSEEIRAGWSLYRHSASILSTDFEVEWVWNAGMDYSAVQIADAESLWYFRPHGGEWLIHMDDALGDKLIDGEPDTWWEIVGPSEAAISQVLVRARAVAMKAIHAAIAAQELDDSAGVQAILASLAKLPAE